MTENFETMPEEELICRAQSQDHAAIDALMRRYKGCLLYTSPSPRDTT